MALDKHVDTNFFNIDLRKSFVPFDMCSRCTLFIKDVNMVFENKFDENLLKKYKQVGIHWHFFITCNFNSFYIILGMLIFIIEVDYFGCMGKLVHGCM